MEGIRSFLESSTVHGLSYISSTRKYARFFWIVVVLAGFSTAGYLIYQSFQSWADSPVKTTVETLPISEITFPKITVCPPRNTFTDLNYDLMLVENVFFLDQPLILVGKLPLFSISSMLQFWWFKKSIYPFISGLVLV